MMSKNNSRKNRSTFRRILLYWLPVVVWVGVIFLFSANPTTRASEIRWQDFIVKKTAHMVVYAILSLLIYRALKTGGMEIRKAGYYSIFFSIIYGFTDEFHQSFTPGREPTFRDVAFDATGSILAIYFVWKYFSKTPEKIRLWLEKLEFV